MSSKNISPSILERVRDSWIEYSHAAYITIVLGAVFFHSAPEKAEWGHKVSLIAIASYFVILLLFLFWFTHTYSRKARYAESLRLVHSSIHNIRDIAGYLERCYRKKDVYSKDVVYKGLQECLDAHARAFALVTGTNCRVCVKLVDGQDPGNAYVRTACRDTVSAADCKEKDRTEGTQHLVNANSDFTYLLHSGHTSYLNGDVQNTNGYINTSAEAYKNKLPYKSVIVLPIRRTYNIRNSGEFPKKPVVVGFLCIDSNSRFSFTEKYDVQMGAVVADALCPILELWYRLDATKKRNTGVTR